MYVHVPIFDIIKNQAGKNNTLKTYINKFPLFNFLDNQNMLKDKYNFLVATRENSISFSSLYIPVKLANKMPFILAALTCKQLNNCLYDNPSLKLFKSRSRNYYCVDLLKKLVSIFGNEKAWDEFDITSKWKPKFKFSKTGKWPLIFVSYFSFMRYGVCATKYIYSTTGVYWANKKASPPVHFDSLPILSNISKRRISRTLNNPNEEAIENIRGSICALEANKDLLSEDGIKLQKDLNLARTLL